MSADNSKSVACPICSLDFNGMNIIERGAHANLCSGHLSDHGDDLDVISISSTEILEVDSGLTRGTDADAANSSKCSLPDRTDRVDINKQFANLLKDCGSNAVEHSLDDDDQVELNKENEIPKSIHTTGLLEDNEKTDHSHSVLREKVEYEASNSEEDKSELVFFKDRRIFQHNLLRRLQESGKVLISPPSASEISEIKEPTQEIPTSDISLEGLSSPKVSSLRTEGTRTRKPEKVPILKRNLIHKQPLEVTKNQTDCWLCGKSVTLGSITIADHLVFCAMLNRDILEAILPDLEQCALPGMVTLSIDRIDAVISKLQRIRKSLNDQLSPPDPKSSPCLSNALPVTKDRADRTQGLSASSKADKSLKATTKASRRPPAPGPVPTCPDYKSMSVAELKKLMANYGFRAGTKAYMVKQLSLAWDAIHSASEPAPPSANEPLEHADEQQLSPTDSFRSPVRNRTRKVLRDSPFSFNKPNV